MDIEKIYNILKKEFPWVYCDTCQRNRQNCGNCNYKLVEDINWELSDEAAIEIALRIRDAITEDIEWINSMMTKLP